LPTLGREKSEVQNEETISNNKKINNKSDENFETLIEGLGGAENIQEIDNCYSRLRINIVDKTKVDIKQIKEYPSSGVIQKGKNIQIVIGTEVQDVKESLDNYIRKDF